MSFVHLWQSPEYAELEALEKVSLCDWITVRHEVLCVDVKAQVVKTVYDTIAERYEKLEIGSARANFQDTLQKTVQDVTNLLKNANTDALTQAYMWDKLIYAVIGAVGAAIITYLIGGRG